MSRSFAYVILKHWYAMLRETADCLLFALFYRQFMPIPTFLRTRAIHILQLHVNILYTYMFASACCGIINNLIFICNSLCHHYFPVMNIKRLWISWDLFYDMGKRRAALCSVWNIRVFVLYVSPQVQLCTRKITREIHIVIHLHVHIHVVHV